MSFAYLHTPEFLSRSLLIISILELPLHIFGAYCILMKTPKMMNSVKWIMLNLHFWSVALDMGITLFTRPFVLFPAMGGIPMGLLTKLGMPTSLQIYLVVTLFGVVCAAIVSIFENRYFLTFGRNTKWRHYRFSFMAFNYFLALVNFLPAYLNAPDQPVGLKILYDTIPDLPDFVYTSNVYVIGTEYSLVVGPVVFMSLLLLSETFSFVWLMYSGTQKALKLMTMSPNTVNMHRRFLRALYIQSCVIMMNMGAPFFYLGFAVPLKYYNQAANNFCFIIYALHGFSSTIVMIWIHKPYRVAFQNLFCLRNAEKRVGDKSISVVVEGRTKSTLTMKTV